MVAKPSLELTKANAMQIKKRVGLKFSAYTKKVNVKNSWETQNPNVSAFALSLLALATYS